MNEIEKYIGATKNRQTFLRPRIICNNGESVSIQASSGHYCSPREDGLNHYYEVEAGYPSSIPPKSWLKYAEDKTKESKWRLVRFNWKMFRNSFKYKMPIKQKLSRLLGWLLSIQKSPLQMTVYAYMPVDVAMEYISAHKGIDFDKTLQEGK